MGYKELEKYALMDIRKAQKRGAPQWLLCMAQGTVSRGNHIYIKSKDKSKDKDYRSSQVAYAKNEVMWASKMCRGFMYPDMFERFNEVRFSNTEHTDTSK